MRVSVEVTGAAELSSWLGEHAARLQASPAGLLAAVGEDWVSRFQANVRAGGVPTVPLAQVTLDLRSREAGPGRVQPRWGGGGGTAPLFRTGGLKDSIQVLEATADTLAVGTTREAAALLNFGGVTSPASMIPGRRVPARPFVFLAPEDVKSTIAALADFFFGSEGEAAA